MNLLSENDWNALSNALRRGETVTLARTLGNVEVTAEVAQSSKAWSSAMLVGVEVRRKGRVLVRQWFESVERAKTAVRRWRIR